jgi:preprotein translocase subunit SecG
VSISDTLNIVQIILAILLTVVVMMQSKGSASGGIFGGGDTSTVYRTRRGFEKRLFQFTIGLAIIFFAIALANSLWGT